MHRNINFRAVLDWSSNSINLLFIIPFPQPPVKGTFSLMTFESDGSNPCGHPAIVYIVDYTEGSGMLKMNVCSGL